MYEPDTEQEFDVFTDLLFNSCVAFAFFFFLTFAMVNPVAKTGEIESDAELLFTVRWPDNHADDIDVYVEDPVGNVVWYHQREAGLMHLDRDDRGLFKDVILVNGEERANPLNEEIVSVRGLLDGEYVVNVVHYIATTVEPVPVTVKVEKLNPTLRVLYYGDVTLNGTGQEKTVVRFTIAGDEIRDVNNRPVSLVQLTRQTEARRPQVPAGGFDAATGEARK
ncbi:MAG TPA: hypothetical protein GYA10_08320 [Alphaproteobacteria bacterium]|nr:hypothetical protein [Alphaproteobacteria bacterium]